MGVREVLHTYWNGSESVVEGFAHPDTLRILCGACHSWGVIKLYSFQTNAQAFTTTAAGRCPQCEKIIQFVMVYNSLKTSSRQLTPHVIYATELSDDFLQVEGMCENAGDKLSKLYLDSVSSYNSGRYSEASNLCRKAMEGTLKVALEGKLTDPKKHYSLHDLIEKATQQLDLAEPLKRIALWAKQTGNLNSHYDPDDEPNRQTIRDQLLAARQLATFLIDLPATAKKLESADSDDREALN